MSCVTGIQRRLFHIAMWTEGGDGLLSGLCHMLHLHTICVCACNYEHVCAHMLTWTCVCVCVNSSSRRPRTDTRLGCVRALRQMWLYMIKCLLKGDRASVGIKSGGRREETE